MVLRNCLGMMASVSTLIIGSGAATPVRVVNFSMAPRGLPLVVVSDPLGLTPLVRPAVGALVSDPEGLTPPLRPQPVGQRPEVALGLGEALDAPGVSPGGCAEQRLLAGELVKPPFNAR